MSCGHPSAKRWLLTTRSSPWRPSISTLSLCALTQFTSFRGPHGTGHARVAASTEKSEYSAASMNRKLIFLRTFGYPCCIHFAQLRRSNESLAYVGSLVEKVARDSAPIGR